MIFILFGLLVFVSRWPWAPGQLFTFDDVNLAYSIGHFDVRISQPHPPGYPLFVMEMRVLHWLRFRRAESVLLVLALSGSLSGALSRTDNALHEWIGLIAYRVTGKTPELLPGPLP